MKLTRIAGHLEKDGEKIGAHFFFASRFSVFVKFLENQEFPENTRFNRMKLILDEEEIDFSACKIAKENNQDVDGRLIFIEEIYDFESLFYHKVIRSNSTAFYNLPLLLDQKNRIRHSFRDYSSGLTYDLKIYKQFFDNIDLKSKNEPVQVKSSMQNTIIEREGKKFLNFFDSSLADLEQCVSGFTREEHEAHGFYFRKQVSDFIVCSKLMALTNLKPRGFAGDAEMMDLIYENRYRGESIFEQLMHKHGVGSQLGDSIRNRRDAIARVLRKVYDDFSGNLSGRLRFMSVGCGPAVELENIYLNESDFDKYEANLLDHDNLALEKASENVNKLENERNGKIKVNYINESVRTMLRTPQLPEKWGKFHFIYATGLFEYFTPPTARAILRKLFAILEPGGHLFIGNFHIKNPDKYYLEYWFDWVLYYRTEEEFMDLLDPVMRKETMIYFDESGIQMFLQVRKP